MNEIFIKGNFPSFKNSKQFTGQYFIMSKTVQKYLKAWEYQWKTIPHSFEKQSVFPIIVGLHFVRGTKHRWDFHNMVQGVADLMVKHKWIEDDNTLFFLPVPMKIKGAWWSYDKENPGVYIKIMN